MEKKEIISIIPLRILKPTTTLLITLSTTSNKSTIGQLMVKLGDCFFKSSTMLTNLDECSTIKKLMGL